MLLLVAACAAEPAGGRGLGAVVGEGVGRVRAAAVVRRGEVEARSTIAAADYIGPVACGECHAEQLAAWERGLHRRMNQRLAADVAGPAGPAGPTVIGDFAEASLAYQGGVARFTQDAAGVRRMILARGGTTRRYRITRTIGTRALQEYVGVLEDAAGAAPGEEVRLPFAWWTRRGGWYPQPYFDPWFASEAAFDAYAPLTEPWATRCPWCHSTYPFAQRLARAAARDVGHGFEQFFTAPASAAPPAADPERLDVAAQITPGISCESCHLGGRAHADGAPIHFVPIGAPPRPGAPAPAPFGEERRTATIVNRVCAQCHSGPSPRLADGAALRNSSEALDLAASPCTTARCTDCHDPHAGGVDEARALAACTGCHGVYADPATARAHAGHAPAAASCLDCHMPRLVMGLDRMVRSHRISSPTDPALLRTAGPNACNACHLDRPITWTVAELARGFEVRLDPRGWQAYGDLDAPVGDVWLASREPALRLYAAHAYARSPLGGAALPALVRALEDPLPHVRAWTLLALEDLLGRRIPPAEFDPRAAPAERRRQLDRARLDRARPAPR